MGLSESGPVCARVRRLADATPHTESIAQKGPVPGTTNTGSSGTGGASVENTALDTLTQNWTSSPPEHPPGAGPLPPIRLLLAAIGCFACWARGTLAGSISHMTRTSIGAWRSRFPIRNASPAPRMPRLI